MMSRDQTDWNAILLQRNHVLSGTEPGHPWQRELFPFLRWPRQLIVLDPSLNLLNALLDLRFCSMRESQAAVFSNSASLSPKRIQISVPVRGHENVGWLDVAVHDTPCMSSVECIRNLHAEVEDRSHLHRRAPNQVERLPFKHLHGNESPAVLLTNVVDGANVGMI